MDAAELSARLMLATTQAEVLSVAQELAAAALEQTTDDVRKQKTVTKFLQFSQKEIAKMPKTFKREFIANGCVAHVIKRPSGKHTFFYEIRYRRNGYNVSAGATCLEKAKKKFLDKLIETMQNESQRGNSRPTVRNIAREWFACREGHVSPLTIKNYRSYYDRLIDPRIGHMDITDVRTYELRAILSLCAGKGRAYEDTRSVLNQIFVFAQNNGLIQYNPVRSIAFVRAERTHGQALSLQEIERLLTEASGPFRDCWMLQLFCGLRPCEVSSARIENGFVVARNAKRKHGKIEYKRIPIPPEARGILRPTKLKRVTSSNAAFKRLFPNHTQYDLRHTFSTVCQMYVRREVVEIWLGDSSERLIGNTYTHFPDYFMLSEMERVRFLPDKNNPGIFPKI